MLKTICALCVLFIGSVAVLFYLLGQRNAKREKATTTTSGRQLYIVTITPPPIMDPAHNPFLSDMTGETYEIEASSKEEVRKLWDEWSAKDSRLNGKKIGSIKPKERICVA